jgi:hypothetical protein
VIGRYVIAFPRSAISRNAWSRSAIVLRERDAAEEGEGN